MAEIKKGRHALIFLINTGARQVVRDGMKNRFGAALSIYSDYGAKVFSIHQDIIMFANSVKLFELLEKLRIRTIPTLPFYSFFGSDINQKSQVRPSHPWTNDIDMEIKKFLQGAVKHAVCKCAIGIPLDEHKLCLLEHSGDVTDEVNCAINNEKTLEFKR